MALRTPILITGASGFIGANLLRRLTTRVPKKDLHVLLRKQSNTWRVDDILKKTSVHIADLRDKKASDALIKKIKPRTIFHLAAHGAYPSQQQDEDEIIQTNIISTFNLFQSCLAQGFDAFVNTGSSSEYGAKTKPMRETDSLEPVIPYAVSKAWATLYAEYLTRTQKAPIITLRPFGIYGYYEPQGRLVPNIILALMRGEQPRLASPTTARDFVFVEDMVDAYLNAASRPTAGTIFNIGSGKQTTIKELFIRIQNIMRTDIEPIWDTRVRRSFDTTRWVADVSRAKAALKWKADTKLEDGLARTIHWFKKNRALYHA
jgi:nucleoside-diphosphate-sugar epimerase